MNDKNDRERRPKTGKPIFPAAKPKRTRKCPLCKQTYYIVHGHICKKK